PGKLAGLHRAAAEWCDAHGLVDETIHHALAAGDAAWAARLIERHYDALFLRAEGATVDRWGEALPEGLLGSRPRLRLAPAGRAGGARGAGGGGAGGGGGGQGGPAARGSGGGGGGGGRCPVRPVVGRVREFVRNPPRHDRADARRSGAVAGGSGRDGRVRAAG